VEDLRFDPGKEFVLFLERRGGRLDYLKTPAKNVEATAGAIDIVKSCIKRSAHKQLN
jgi:hypothetical protein